MELRLIPFKGGDGTVHGITVMNDTGSSILSLFDIDMHQLGDLSQYTGYAPPVEVVTASGASEFLPCLVAQVRLVRQDLTPWTVWINEKAVFRRIIPGMTRLSGATIRDRLYFGTAPGNHFVAVAETKHGLNALL